MNRRRIHTASARGGFVLVCVLWILVILTVLALGFGKRALLDAQAAAYALDHNKAMMMARGAVQRGIAELRNKAITDFYAREDGGTGLGQAWARPGDLLENGQYFDLGDPALYDEEICRYYIRDEESRISINAAPEELLAGLDAFNNADARKIVRRRTEGLDPDQPGQRYLTVEELRYLDVVDDEEWDGDEETPGVRDLLTCWGSGKINLNTASRRVLRCVPDLDEGLIERILFFRAGEDSELGTEDDRSFKTVLEIRDVLGVGEKPTHPLLRHCTTNSQCFTITGVATLQRGKVRACCKATVYVGSAAANVVQWREVPDGP